jgi:hypothetical protein
MNSGPSRHLTVTSNAEPRDEPWLQPWQFFLLGGMLAATATVIVATGQTAPNIIVLSLTVVSVSFVGLGAYRTLLPLVSADVELPPSIGGRTRVAIEREKTLVLRSIKELEFDYAMGKVATADYDEMSARLRQRAVGLMRQLDEGGGYKEQIAREVESRLEGAQGAQGALEGDLLEGDGFSRRREEATAEATALHPCVCGTANDEDARFCKQCGARLS